MIKRWPWMVLFGLLSVLEFVIKRLKDTCEERMTGKTPVPPKDP